MWDTKNQTPERGIPMTATFDPYLPADPADPTAACIEGDITSIVITEAPVIGKTNLVVNRAKPFDVKVSWRVFGNLAPLWLTALAASTPDWVVTAYAEPEGPGNKAVLGTVKVPVRSQPMSQNVLYSAKLTVAAGTLPEEDPGNPSYTGVYKIVVTAFLDSTLGLPGYDMMGFAEGPIIKVENPL